MALPTSSAQTSNPLAPISDTTQGTDILGNTNTSGTEGGTINGVDGIATTTPGQYILDEDQNIPSVAAGDGSDYIQLGDASSLTSVDTAFFGGKTIDGNQGDDNIQIDGYTDMYQPTSNAGVYVSYIQGGEGSDSIEIDAAVNDVIRGENFSDALTRAGDGDDTITIGNAEGSTIDTNGGNDEVYIGTETDYSGEIERAYFGDGNDTVEIYVQDSTANDDGGNYQHTPTIAMGTGDDSITYVNDASNANGVYIYGDYIQEGADGNDTVDVTGVNGGLSYIYSDDTYTDTDAQGGTGDDVLNITDVSNAYVGSGHGNDTITATGDIVLGDEQDDYNGGDSVATATNGGFISAGSGVDSIVLDGTTGQISAEVYGGNGTTDYDAEGPDTFNITTAGGDDIIYLDDFTDEGTGDVYDAGLDDVLILNGTEFDWAQLEEGATLQSGIVSITNVIAAAPGANIGGRIRIETTDGSIVDVDHLQVACFMNGTSIATAAGDVAVETLAIGDMVTTADGNTAPVKWIGRREVSSVFAAKNASVQPILITAGALGNGLPTADLRVSPDHAMFVDGVLIHADALVNGSTIVKEAIAETFTYFHIELENHDLVLANGAPAETFVDSDVRARFDNAAEYVALYGTAESAAPMALPRVKSKRQLPAALKAKLA